jgi:hypothetical protein
LYTGLDLKDDLSRFQIIVKVPYPDLGDRWINEKANNEQWYNWQTSLRLVQGYGRSIRSKEDSAATYVLDSRFENFVKRNKNILPDWFTQTIQPSLSLGHAVFVNSSKVHITSKENHYNPSIISEQTLKQNVNMIEKNEIASKPSGPSEILPSLDRYIEDESNIQERLFICPYCPKFTTALEIEYQRHIVLKHPGKLAYPNMAAAR